MKEACGYDIAIAFFEVLDEMTGSNEFTLTSWAGDVLICGMGLTNVSIFFLWSMEA